MVIILAIFVASFSFWLVQERLAQSQFSQRRNMEISLLSSALTTFQSQGERATRELIERWRSHPASRNILIIKGDSKRELLGRAVSANEIENAYNHAIKNPTSNLSVIYYDPFGEEYLFFIRNFDNEQVERMPSLLIPGLQLAPVWHEFIIFAGILAVGLLMAYILASNISKPIQILEHGMRRLAAGELGARVSQQLDYRQDELASLGVQFDKMAAQLQILVEKERHLLHHVSHEMRSPLARIQAIVGLLQARPEKQADYIVRLESELMRMDTLVGELLTLSRLETANIPMEKEKMAVLPFLEQVVQDSQSIAEQHGHRVALDAGSLHENVSIMGNESYLYRALDNVIRNAMKYSPDGSVIGVRAYDDRKSVHIEITDNGPGVKPEQLAHIFTAFYRADSSNGKDGTGLGLAITKHIAQQHDGKLIAENVSPNGLKMHFIFPKCAKKQVESKSNKAD